MGVSDFSSLVPLCLPTLQLLARGKILRADSTRFTKHVEPLVQPAATLSPHSALNSVLPVASVKMTLYWSLTRMVHSVFTHMLVQVKQTFSVSWFRYGLSACQAVVGNALGCILL